MSSKIRQLSLRMVAPGALFGYVLPLLLVAISFALLMGLEKAEPEKGNLPPVTVEGLMPFVPIAEVATVVSLAEKSETLDINVNGTVVPYREIDLAAEVAGRITEKDVTVRSGNYVKKGQILFRIDPRDYELEVERLSRKRDQERASIEELKMEIANAEELEKVAQEELQLAQGEVKRLESLDRGFSSAAELDQARRSRLTSLNQLVTIQNQKRALKSRQARLELAARLAETELERAQLDLKRTEIRSPVDGRIVSDEVEADSYVQRGTLLVVVEDTSKVEVACNVRMDQLRWILEQPAKSAAEIVDPVQVARYELPPTEVEVHYHVDGQNSYRWKGVLDRFEGAGLDPQSRTVPIRIRVDHPEQILTDDNRPAPASGMPMLVRGMYVEATIKAKPATNLLLVPKLSIKPGSESSKIWKFVPDSEAVFETPIALKAKQAQDQTDRGRSSPEPSSGTATSKAASVTDGSSRVQPQRWVAGFLKIVRGVRVIGPYGSSEDRDAYWVCEVPEGGLSAGDEVVVTPIPNLKADGRDPIRVAKPSEAEVNLAAKKIGNRS